MTGACKFLRISVDQWTSYDSGIIIWLPNNESVAIIQRSFILSLVLKYFNYSLCSKTNCLYKRETCATCVRIIYSQIFKL